MSNTIYVANLPDSTTEDDMTTLFSPYGEVYSVKLISAKDSSKPLGYGFVEIEEGSAVKAIHELNGKEFKGQTLQVNQARGRSEGR